MAIFVSEPARPGPTRLPEALRARRITDPDQSSATKPAGPETDEPIDPAHFRWYQGRRQQPPQEGVAQYQEEMAQERDATQDYLPVRSLSSNRIVAIESTQSVVAAMRLMEARGIHHLLVTTQGALAGLVDMQWLLHSLWQGTESVHENTPLANLTLPSFITVTPETDAHELALQMLGNHLSAAVVVDAKNQPAGIVTDSDYLRLYADSRQVHESI
ncbi:CBS domain-containing protein [Marinobacteraceae bacterium S3BR75-40.1]